MHNYITTVYPTENQLHNSTLRRMQTNTSADKVSQTFKKEKTKRRADYTSEHELSDGAQADQMLQVILTKMNEQNSNKERSMAL